MPALIPLCLEALTSFVQLMAYYRYWFWLLYFTDFLQGARWPMHISATVGHRQFVPLKINCLLLCFFAFTKHQTTDWMLHWRIELLSVTRCGLSSCFCLSIISLMTWKILPEDLKFICCSLIRAEVDKTTYTVSPNTDCLTFFWYFKKMDNILTYR